MVPTPIRVIALEGRKELARYSLGSGIYVIGRSSDCDLRLEGEGVMERHASLNINDLGEIAVNDLSGVAGTLLDGEPISGSAPVSPNQTLQLGTISLLVQQRMTLPGDEKYGDADLLLPQEFHRAERYEIGSELARGGMGAVLTARQVTIRRPVALKRILGHASRNPRQRMRFIEEAQITGQLEHPNIVPVYDLAVDEEGHPYYTMKLVQGITFKKVIQLLQRNIPEAAAKYPLPALLTIFQKVCDAVGFAHSKGVIHRDLKPANIMVGAFGEVLVMDWGLAKVLRATAPQDLLSDVGSSQGISNPAMTGSSIRSARMEEGEDYRTLDGVVVGTPHFMAPEQARGDIDRLDERTDIFALGSILYQILTLELPFSGANVAEILERIQRGDFIPAATRVEESNARLGKSLSAPEQHEGGERQSSSSRAPGKIRSVLPHLPGGRVPESLDAIVRKAMAVKPEHRYQNIAQLQADLTAYQTGFATSAEGKGALKLLKLLIRRNKAAALGTLSVLVVAAVFGAGVILQGRRATRALADLKRTAPALRQLADTEASFQRFDSALATLDGAIALDPDHLPSYWRRAWLLLGIGNFGDASSALTLARHKDPAQVGNASILPMVEELARVPESERWTPERRDALSRHLRKVGASAELTALSAKLQLSAKDNFKLVRARLDEWLGVGNGWVNMTSAGLIEVGQLPKTLQSLAPLSGLPINNLEASGLQIRDIEVARNLPLISLNISYTKVTDIAPLRGKRLNFLAAHDCIITDWSPLIGMPLRALWTCGGTINDLSFLVGAPIEEIDAYQCSLSDISALKGAPLRKARLFGNHLTNLDALLESKLESLDVNSNPLTTIAALKGKPLVYLNLSNTNVTDISPLRGSPITLLHLDACPIHDFTPLADMPALREIWLQRDRQPDALRGHPTLNYINWGRYDQFARFSVTDFWPMYDAKRAADKIAAKKTLEELIATKGKKLPDGTLELDCSDLRLKEIDALKGVRVSVLWADRNPLLNVAPLTAIPIKVLSLRNTQVSDLAPLRSMPLRMLHLHGSPVSDLSPLRGLPLEYLYLDGTRVKDVSPLLQLPALRRVTIPKAATNIGILRGLSNLEQIGWEGDWQGDINFGGPGLTPAEFWKRYDAEDATRRN
jgi:serine/threonine protein kinase/Leucine-rich repeat (LRR) protein